MNLIAKIFQNSIKSLLRQEYYLKTVSTRFSNSSCSNLFTDISITTANHNSVQKSGILKSQILNLSIHQQRNYKQKLRLRKRCKSCYFIWRNGRLYVECLEHPRHKQHHVNSFLRGFDNIPNGYMKYNEQN